MASVRQFLVLTADVDLYVALQSRGIDALDFNHPDFPDWSNWFGPKSLGAASRRLDPEHQGQNLPHPQLLSQRAETSN